ncbi:hypothetical protein HKBW3S03_01715, partial [Candidatus Hakubella thermalkaliphila]
EALAYHVLDPHSLSFLYLTESSLQHVQG